MKPNKEMRKSIAEWKVKTRDAKGVPYDNKCVACNGSGYYDTQRNGKTPKCGSCEGTGKN